MYCQFPHVGLMIHTDWHTMI